MHQLLQLCRGDELLLDELLHLVDVGAEEEGVSGRTIIIIPPTRMGDDGEARIVVIVGGLLLLEGTVWGGWTSSMLLTIPIAHHALLLLLLLLGTNLSHLDHIEGRRVLEFFLPLFQRLHQRWRLRT